VPNIPLPLRFRRRTSRRTLLQGSLGAAGLLLVSCSAPSAFRDDEGDPFDLVARPAADEWPPLFWEAPEVIQETYRYAVANQELLRWMPCFCGCGDLGHTSNASCYVVEQRADGSVLLDPMSFG
jgi:hypothetical protein